VSRSQKSAEQFAEATFTVITESDVVSETWSEWMTEKRFDSDLAVEVDVARLASVLDFIYEAQLSLLLNFALIWPLTPHPWHMA
jgi:hypothetical protein